MKIGWAVFAILIGACVAMPAGVSGGRLNELDGRTAGPPRRCVAIERSVPLTIANGNPHVLLYGRGQTIWATDLGPDCGFTRGDSLVVQPITGSYCHGDLVRSVSPFSGKIGPACFLGDFVPYGR